MWCSRLMVKCFPAQLTRSVHKLNFPSNSPLLPGAYRQYSQQQLQAHTLSIVNPCTTKTNNIHNVFNRCVCWHQNRHLTSEHTPPPPLPPPHTQPNQRPRRFYTSVDVVHNGNSRFELVVDQRKVKTRSGHVLAVESHQLAVALAAEWDAQQEYIDLNSMHLTALCNTVIDNPRRSSKFDVAMTTLALLEVDTILYRSGEQNERLRTLEEQQWTPELDWFNDRFGVELSATSGIECPSIGESCRDSLRRHLLSHDIWSLHGLLYAAECLKSFVLASNAVQRRISVQQAVHLSRLETAFQIEQWGNIPWAHDIELQDSLSRVAAAVSFVHFNANSSTVKQKLTHVAASKQ